MLKGCFTNCGEGVSISINGYSNQTTSVLKGIWFQGDERGFTVEQGEVLKVVGFAKTPLPADSLYMLVKDDLDV